MNRNKQKNSTTKNSDDDGYTRRLEQQALIAKLGLRALSDVDLDTYMKEVLQTVSSNLGVEYVKVLELLPGEKIMVLRAGVGWKADVIPNQTTLDIGSYSQAGYALSWKKPVIVKDLKRDKRFKGPELLTEHGVRSGVSVVIHGNKSPYGVLGVHTKTIREFTRNDVDFLQSVANLLALVIVRKNTTEDLQNLRYALDQSAIVAITNKSGVIEYVNDMFVEISKYSREELIGKTHRLIKSGYHPKEYIANLWNTILAGKVWRGELRNRAKDGTFYWVDTTVTPLCDSDGNPRRFIAIRKDITERKRLEQLKDEFIAVASHELKTPVTSIKAYGQILKRLITNTHNTKATSLLEKMDRQINKLTVLINDLLDVSKIESGKMGLNKEEFDFNDMVHDVVDEMQRLVDGHSIKLQLDRSAEVVADKDRLSQVLINFIDNAVKYSPRKNEVIVSTRKNGKGIELRVKDRGIGIPKDKQTHIFSRFYRVEEDKQGKFPGLGLGLYISADTIKRHGGEIFVESKEGKGSTFGFLIPTTKK